MFKLFIENNRSSESTTVDIAESGSENIIVVVIHKKVFIWLVQVLLKNLTRPLVDVYNKA